jgi:hypothetical protein
MRIAALFTVAVFLSSPVSAARNDGQMCRPSAPPERPVSSEDNNPGAGVGLNEDLSGRVVGDLISDLAKVREEERGPPIVRDILRDEVGLDCSKADF